MITIDPPSTPRADPPPNKSALTRFLNRARAAVGLSGQVHVLLTSDAELQRLNRSFRRKNKPTDILSFPAAPEVADAIAGDLAISLDTAARQAALFGHTLSDELRILLLHGTLHLAGFDHEADSGEMAAHETALRHQLNLPPTLIARTTPNPAPSNARTTRSNHTARSARPARSGPVRQDKPLPLTKKIGRSK